jgi:hypothetical protein
MAHVLELKMSLRSSREPHLRATWPLGPGFHVYRRRSAYNLRNGSAFACDARKTRETGCIGGANSSASSGLGEFACGVTVDNFAHKSLVKMSIVPSDTKHPFYNLITAILKHSYLPN